jgi:hypothetical protein
MKRLEKHWGGIGGSTAFLLLAAACSQVLGIDEAHVDPGLTPGLTTGGGTGIDASGGTSMADSSPTGGSGGTAGAIDSGGGAVDVGSDSPDSAVCRQYCSDVMEYCKDSLKQYVDAAQCLKTCSYFPEGVITDPDGNSASCRLKYAGKARYAAGSERDAYCRKAGPGSDGTCGAICDGFCTLMMAACTPTFAPYNFPTEGDCLTACKALKDSPPYTVSDGNLPDRNDAQCRLFHVCSSVMDPDEHCEHSMGVTMCDPKLDAGQD